MAFQENWNTIYKLDAVFHPFSQSTAFSANFVWYSNFSSNFSTLLENALNIEIASYVFARFYKS